MSISVKNTMAVVVVVVIVYKAVHGGRSEGGDGRGKGAKHYIGEGRKKGENKE